MEKFYLELPTQKRKQEAIDYIIEHIKAKSNINGSGGLDKGYTDYEGWFKKIKLEEDPDTCPLDRSPAYTYFLIRENDNKIIGMTNLRYILTEFLLEYAGNIGYGIRPTERGKGYSKILLYSVLQKCKELNLEKVLLSADESNPASWKTIEALGGVFEKKVPNKYEEGEILCKYWINVDESLEKYKEEYNKYIL